MRTFCIYSDDSLSQVYEATKVSRRGEISDDIKKQKYTIAYSVGLGHESVLEHTNLIMGFLLSKDDINIDLINLLETCHYLHYRLYDVNSSDRVLIIAGSIRGYKHIFRNIKNMNSKYLEAIKRELYTNSYSDFYQDFIRDGIMDETKFTKFIGKKYPVVTLPNGEAVAVKNAHKDIDNFFVKDRVAVLWYDDILEVQDKILEATGICIPFVDLLEFCTIGVKIWCSRTASHQIVRHRNAVTQESQRYCNYTNDIKSENLGNNSLTDMQDRLANMFVDPCMEDIIAACGGPIEYAKQQEQDTEKNVQYQELLAKYINNDSHIQLMVAADKSLMHYKTIVDKKELRPEDVRAILPNNTKTSLIMTFTYRNLIKAIELRTDKAAQSEIRNIFICLEHILKNQIFCTNEDLNIYICPCKKNNYYCDLEAMTNPISEDEVSEEVFDSEKTEVLNAEDVVKLKDNLKNEYGEDIENIMNTTPKDVFRQ